MASSCLVNEALSAFKFSTLFSEVITWQFYISLGTILAHRLESTMQILFLQSFYFGLLFFLSFWYYLCSSRAAKSAELKLFNKHFAHKNGI